MNPIFLDDIDSHRRISWTVFECGIGASSFGERGRHFRCLICGVRRWRHHWRPWSRWIRNRTPSHFFTPPPLSVRAMRKLVSFNDFSFHSSPAWYASKVKISKGKVNASRNQASYTINLLRPHRISASSSSQCRRHGPAMEALLKRRLPSFGSSWREKERGMFQWMVNAKRKIFLYNSNEDFEICQTITDQRIKLDWPTKQNARNVW